MEAGGISSESITNIRTVNAFGIQERLATRFNAAQDAGVVHANKAHWIGGLLYGFSMFLLNAAYALCFWSGAKFISKGYIDFQDMLRVFFALSMSATVAGQASQMAGDQVRGIRGGAVLWLSLCDSVCEQCACACVAYACLLPAMQTLAQPAKESLFAIMDRKSAVDPLSADGQRPATCEGKVEFRNVSFAYPSRPRNMVLKVQSTRLGVCFRTMIACCAFNSGRELHD